MIRGLALLAAACALSACGLVSMGYARLPDLSVWWVQRWISLDATQSAQLRQDAQTLHDWHRQTQLTAAADVLQHWQALVNEPLTADQACTEFAKVRAQWDALLSQSSVGMVALGRSLSAGQRAELAASQAKAHKTFRQTYLADSAAASGSWLPAAWAATSAADARLGNLSDRYARLYGKLTPAQTDALARLLAQSRFDPARTLAERERRTQDLLQTLHKMTPATSDADGLQLVRAWLDKLATSPTPGYAAYSQTLLREACEQLAQVHALATPAQKTHAKGVLAGYEADLRQLLGQR